LKNGFEKRGRSLAMRMEEAFELHLDVAAHVCASSRICHNKKIYGQLVGTIHFLVELHYVMR